MNGGQGNSAKAKYGSISLLGPEYMTLPPEVSVTLDSIVRISYVGGCSVSSTSLCALRAHCLRYSTRKKASKISKPRVGLSKLRICVPSISRQARASLRDSEHVRLDTRQCLVASSPSSCKIASASRDDTPAAPRNRR